MARYADRVEAGRRLGAALGPLDDALVLGLPRGGVVVGAQVAAACGGVLDVVVVRKLGAPEHPEYAVGALAEDDEPQWDPAASQLSARAREALVRKEAVELLRRRAAYRDGPLPALAGRLVVVVDDGLATGATARAALDRVRRDRPSRLVLAVPVGAPEVVRVLAGHADEVVCPWQPAGLGSVGACYEDFREVTDAEVVALLRDGQSGSGCSYGSSSGC